MLIREFLTERISIEEDVQIRDTTHMAAYCIAVSEAYDALPQVDPSTVKLWQALATQNRDVMLSKIAKAGVKVVYTPHDPYGINSDDPKMVMRYMLWDMVMNHRLQIYSGHSDNHPVFSEDDNVIFRTVHDYFTHGRLRGMFKQQLEKLGLLNRPPSPEQLATILPTIKLNMGGNIGHVFSMRGEMNAFLTHAKLASPQIVPVLFTEIVGQACYFTVVNNFPQQKAAIIHGFDYQRIGQASSPQTAARIQILRTELGTQPEVQTHVTAKPVVESAEMLARVAR